MIKSAPYYWVECDSCGKSAQENCEFAAWSDAGTALDGAVDAMWSIRTDGQAHHCEDCEAWCQNDGCLNLAGPLSGERDYMCPACWEKAEGECQSCGEVHATPLPDGYCDQPQCRVEAAIRAGERV